MKSNHLSTLYLRLPSRSAAKTLTQWQALPLSFALAARNGRVMREGEAVVSTLASSVAQVQRVVLMFAASDVTVLQLAVPPLPASKLRAALPGLVEDRLITDPAECVLVAGPRKNGLCAIAVIERHWLQSVIAIFSGLGARRIVALPMQLCLPLQSGGLAAAVAEGPGQIDLALRFSIDEGIGLPVIAGATNSAIETEVCRALFTLAAHKPVVLMVPVSRVEAYRAAVVHLADMGGDILIRVDSWQDWLEAVERPVLDLMTGMASDQSLSINWRRWRWPLVLAGLLLATNVVALNWDWWRLKSEGEALHAGMIRVYKTTFPNDVVIVDPLVQMQKKITALRKRSGEITPSDFLSLAATLGEIEKTLPDKSGDESTKFSIAALEYRDAILVVRFKLGTNPPTEAVRTALAARHITLTDAPPENGATVWRLRSAL